MKSHRSNARSLKRLSKRPKRRNKSDMVSLAALYTVGALCILATSPRLDLYFYNFSMAIGTFLYVYNCSMVLGTKVGITISKLHYYLNSHVELFRRHAFCELRHRLRWILTPPQLFYGGRYIFSLKRTEKVRIPLVLLAKK